MAQLSRTEVIALLDKERRKAIRHRFRSFIVNVDDQTKDACGKFLAAVRDVQTAHAMAVAVIEREYPA